MRPSPLLRPTTSGAIPGCPHNNPRRRRFVIAPTPYQARYLFLMDGKTKTEEAFWTDLRELEKKYPMCYIEAWTPDDFDCTEGDIDDKDTDWQSPLWPAVVRHLGKGFDANCGTNWDRIAYSKKVVLAKTPTQPPTQPATQ